jgi:hypothetical protein
MRVAQAVTLVEGLQNFRGTHHNISTALFAGIERTIRAAQ